MTGAKVSLFDVSDLTEPLEVAVWTAPDGWNDIGWDHRAFLWWAPEELAVIPVTVWNEWSGAVVLRVTDGTITEVGRVDHEIEGEEPAGPIAASSPQLTFRPPTWRTSGPSWNTSSPTTTTRCWPASRVRWA